jgi:hypothetical protein
MTASTMRSVGLAALLLGSAGRLTAQHQGDLFVHWTLGSEAGRPTPRGSMRDETEGTQPTETSTLVLAGLAGAVVAAFTGGYVATKVDGDDDDLEAAVIGGSIGITLAVPMAVHLANHRRGNLGLSLLASGLVGGGALAVALASDNGTILLLAPVTQLVTSVAIEEDALRGD